MAPVVGCFHTGAETWVFDRGIAPVGRGRASVPGFFYFTVIGGFRKADLGRLRRHVGGIEASALRAARCAI